MSGLFPPSVRRPRLQVMANGAPIAGVCEAEVISNSHYSADRFSVTVALGADPLWTGDYWSSQSSMMLEVQIGFIPDGAPEGAASWVSLVQGNADTIQIEMPAQVVRVHGRDLTAPLIGTRMQETFANRTSSEIVGILAQRHNMSVQATATSTLVGRYYELEHDRITLNQFSRTSTEWDLLAFLAENEGFDLFVQGTTLFFQPTTADSSTPDAVLRPSPTSNGPANVVDLRMERTLALASDVEVTVKSWNCKQRNAYTQSARATGNGNSGSAAQSYVFVRPNLLPEDAQRLAQNWLTTLSVNERIIEVLMAGELALTARSLIALEGTGTAFDQTYYVDRIERRIRFDGGFVQRVRAKNSSSQGQSTTPGNAATPATG